MKKVVFSVLALSTFSLNSCRKNELSIDTANAVGSNMKIMSSLSDDNLEILYKDFAKAFSIVTKDSEVRNYILSKVKNQHNGDYEVLYMHVKDQTFKNGLTFERLIITASGNTLSASVLNENKLLSICMPVNIEKVTSSIIPSVVYGDDEKALTISGFDSFQKDIRVDNKIAPTNAYWVIRNNERYDLQGKTIARSFNYARKSSQCKSSVNIQPSKSSITI